MSFKHFKPSDSTKMRSVNQISGAAYLQEPVKIGVVHGRPLGEGIAEVMHGCLAVALQVGHDVRGVMPPQ